MNGLRSVIQDHWDALAASDASTSWLTSSLPVEVAGSRLLCAIGPDGKRHLLVPLAARSRPQPDTRSAAVHLLPLVLEAGHGLRRYVDLVLLRSDLSEVFTGLCADIVAALEIEPRDATRAMTKVLDSWRELLNSGRQLGIEQLAGIFGELTVLNALLDLGADMLKSWKGPLRHPQDFQVGDKSIEVKATASSEGQLIRIHGIDQLAAPFNGSLMLWWMRFDMTSSGGTSLPELVRRTTVRTGQPRELWQLLARSGYYLADADRYGDILFRLTEQYCYRVDDEFPRIIRASFSDGQPAGVSDIRYTVDLKFGPPPLQDHEVDAFMRGMAAL